MEKMHPATSIEAPKPSLLLLEQKIAMSMLMTVLGLGCRNRSQATKGNAVISVSGKRN